MNRPSSSIDVHDASNGDHRARSIRNLARAAMGQTPAKHSGENDTSEDKLVLRRRGQETMLKERG